MSATFSHAALNKLVYVLSLFLADVLLSLPIVDKRAESGLGGARVVAIIARIVRPFSLPFSLNLPFLPLLLTLLLMKHFLF